MDSPANGHEESVGSYDAMEDVGGGHQQTTVDKGKQHRLDDETSESPMLGFHPIDQYNPDESISAQRRVQYNSSEDYTDVEDTFIDLTSLPPPSNVPDITKGRSMHEIPGIMVPYDAYRNGYADSSLTMESHLERAKAFVHALLCHLYPESQKFGVHPEEFRSMVADYGWSIEEIDTIVPPKKNKKSIRGAPALVDERPPDPATGIWGRFHHIPRACISGFVVKHAHLVTNPDDPDFVPFWQTRPHTYVAIMVDGLKSMDYWKKKAKSQGQGHTNNRADVMSLALSMEAEIIKAYCFMIVGYRLECYLYHDKKDVKDPFTTIWDYDLRTADPSEVAKSLESIVQSDVVYNNPYGSRNEAVAGV